MFKMQPIESLGLDTRATNALRRGGIHTVGALIQMSQKDIFELRNVGVLSREEITKAIESIVQSGKIVYHEREEESKAFIETAPESSRLSELLPEIESIRLDDVPFSVRARNALKRANIQTADELGPNVREGYHGPSEMLVPKQETKYLRSSMQ